MEELPEALVLDILSRLDDSADVARCRFAWNTFNSVSPGLRFINLQWRLQRYLDSRSGASSTSSSTRSTSPLKRIFLNLVSNSIELESVRIGVENLPLDVSSANLEDDGNDLWLTDGDFVKEWLPRVSGALKSLSISDFLVQSFRRRSEVLSLLSAHCHNILVELELKKAWLSVENMNTMPKLTTLTLESIRLDDKNLTELNKCFPNLQVLNLIGVSGLKMPMINLSYLKTCHWTVTDSPSYISLVTPNLITLRLECISPAALYIEAPTLCHLHLAIDQVNAFAVGKFQNLKTVWLECPNMRSLLNGFLYIGTVETLTLDSRDLDGGADGSSKFSIGGLHKAFPNMTSLCFNSRAWSGFNVWYGDAIAGLKIFRGYVSMVDPSLTFSSVDCMLDGCYNVVDVSLLIHRDVAPNVLKGFITKCRSRWPEVKWRWGMWGEGIEDSWLTDEQLPKKSSRRKNQTPNQKKLKRSVEE